MNMRKGLFGTAAVLMLSAASWGATWSQPASSATPYDWNVDANWGGAAFPNGEGADAAIALDVTGSSTLTVNLRQDISVGSLALGDTGTGTDRPVTVGNLTGEAFKLTFDVASGNATLTGQGAGNTISAGVVLADNLAISNSSVLALSGGVSGGGSIVKNGTGTLNLYLSNNFTGGFTLNEGAVAGQNNTMAVFGTGRLTLNGGSIYHSQSNGSSLSNKVTIGGNVSIGGSNTAITFNAGTASDAFVLNAANPVVNWGMTDATKISNINAQISEATAGNGVTFTGSSTNGTNTRVKYSGTVANTYTGTTTVESIRLSLEKTTASHVAIPGNLVIGGHATKQAEVLITQGTGATNAIADTATVTVLAKGTFNLNGKSETVSAVNLTGGKLIGKGTLTAPVTAVGGTIVPGGTGAGTLNIAGALSLDADSVLNFELNGTDMTVGSNVNDLTGGVTDLTLAGTLNVAELGSFAAAKSGDAWRLIDYSGSLSGSGLTLQTAPTLGEGLRFEVDTTTAGQVNLVVVPEPATMTLLVLGGGLALLRRRRA